MDIIVDIDGTIANADHRVPMVKVENPDWDRFFDMCIQDEPYPIIIDLVQQLMGEANRIIFVTGRPERIRSLTLQWMERVMDESIDVSTFLMMMRRDGDFRPDDVVKLEMLHAMRQLGFKPELVIEDRKRVVEMYRKEGLTVLQCAEGDY